MLQTVPDDETAVFNAQEMIRVCQENQNAGPTPTLEADGSATPDMTETPVETEEP
jgi:hypothetical protein